MTRERRDSGFGLVSALFLLVVLSAAASFMLNLGGAQRTTVNLAIQGAKAFHAARSGVEWGIYQLATTGVCFGATNIALTEGGLSGFTVNVTCASSDHTEATTAATGRVYNVGTGRGRSVLEVHRACEKVTGRKIPYEVVARRPGDPPELVANTDKLERELGWRARFTDVEQVIVTAWRWHESHPDGYGRGPGAQP